MAKLFTGKRPDDLRGTLRAMLSYLGRHKTLLIVVGVLAAVSALCNLLGTYMIRPVVNSAVSGGSGLTHGVLVTAVIYALGALAALGFTQIMVRAAQRVLYDIRRDLYGHLQSLPLGFFDSQRRGDLMSLFTNDVDTISDALNNSFAMLIQYLIEVVGTLVLLFVLNWRLSFLVVLGYLAMFLYIRFSTRRSRFYFNRQQKDLGALDGYLEEMVAGQKVVKVFGHEKQNLEGFARRNEALRLAGTSAQSYAGTMVPAVVTISYINYAVIAVLGGIMVMNGLSDVGSLASYLVFVRQAAKPINQLTQQGNFLLAALAGAERIFRVMQEPGEEDTGTIELVNVKVGSDGTLTACPEKTGHWAWRDSAADDAPLVPLRGDVRFEQVIIWLYSWPPYLTGHQPLCKAGTKDRVCRLNRCRKDNAHQLNQPVLRCDSGPCDLRWNRCAPHPQGRPAPLTRCGFAGYPSVHRDRCGQYPFWQAGCDARRNRAGRQDRRCGLVYSASTAGIQHNVRAGRCRSVTGTAAAAGDRPRSGC